MAVREIKKGTIIYTEQDIVESLDIILKGSVRISNSFSRSTLTNGSILGIMEAPGSGYSYSYEALEDTNIYSHPYHDSEDVAKVIKSNPKITTILASSAVKNVVEAWETSSSFLLEASSFCRFMKENYESYLSLCRRFSLPAQSFQALEELEPFQQEDMIPSWIPEYFTALNKIPSALKKEFFGQSTDICLGIIEHSTEILSRLSGLNSEIADYMTEASDSIINEAGGNLFDLYSNLVFKASKNPFNDTTPIEASVSKLIIFLENTHFTDKEILKSRIRDYRESLQDINDMLLQDEEDIGDNQRDTCEALAGSLETILNYAAYPEKEASVFRETVYAYRQLADKNSTDDDARKLRRKISEHFYRIYESAFIKSLTDSHIPTVLKMFFHFGYMDEELLGLPNAISLYRMAEKRKPDPENRVFTIYEWLRRITSGEEEPSKNEFDLDYPAYLREQRASGNITSAEEKELRSDQMNKLHYEISNMFTSVNKITFGRVTTFCPLLSEHNILKPLHSICQTPETVNKAINELRKIDFSCFYRETIFSDPGIGINSETVHKEVLPYVILAPNIGTRGCLWQEISSSRRDTPARMMMSIFLMEDINDIIPKLAGEFRWELCKRIQGVHWNDVSDRSLTSEYCDYVQFYRKNRELSTEAKEKMKVALQKAKNNYRNVFVMDYVSWIKYEGSGSPRLNRYARSILFTYCPFPVQKRESLKVNPLYTELSERYRIKQNHKLHLIDLLTQKLQNNGKKIPEILTEERAFLNM